MIRKSYITVDGRPIARVTFTLPESIWADTIHLVGDFNDWNRTGHPFQRDREGRWTITVDLELRRAYQFRYLRDGEEWMNDGDADAYVYNPFGGNNFVIVTDPSFRRYCDERSNHA